MRERLRVGLPSKEEGAAKEGGSMVLRVFVGRVGKSKRSGSKRGDDDDTEGCCLSVGYSRVRFSTTTRRRLRYTIMAGTAPSSPAKQTPKVVYKQKVKTAGPAGHGVASSAGGPSGKSRGLSKLAVAGLALGFIVLFFNILDQFKVRSVCLFAPCCRPGPG